MEIKETEFKEMESFVPNLKDVTDMQLLAGSDPLANTYCGFIAIIGRPNVGKSTLINKMVGEKISITADKPQTTRHNILGVQTLASKQAVYIDTPGIHFNNKKAINKYMNKAARSSLQEVEMIVFVVEAGKWTDEDQNVLDIIEAKNIETILVVNKSDLVKDKTKLLPFIEKITKQKEFAAVIPLSAKTGLQVDVLQQRVMAALPPSPHYFASDATTDKQLKFRIAEIIREKLTRCLGMELPYALTVEIEKIEDVAQQKVIHAAIWVERNSQKQIVIGKGGKMLKLVGTSARKEINQLLAARTHLQLWVKVQSGWSNSHKELQNLGYSLR